MLEKLLKKIEKLEEAIGGLTSGAAPAEPEMEPEPEVEDEGEPEPEPEPAPQRFFVEDEDYGPIHAELQALVALRTKIAEVTARHEVMKAQAMVELVSHDSEAQFLIKQLKEKYELEDPDECVLSLPDDENPHSSFKKINKEQ